MVCNNRGRCVETYDEPTDPPVSEEFQGSVEAVDEEVFVGEEEIAIVLQFVAQPARRQVSYRVETQAAWLSAAQPRGTFRDRLRITLNVDRSALEPGKQATVVVVHTDVGRARARVVVEHDRTGTYQGSLEYVTPRFLGAVPIQLHLIDGAGSVDVQVAAAVSPTFPVVDDQPLTTVAVVDGGSIEGQIVQLYSAHDLADLGLNVGPVGRVFDFKLRPTRQGGFTGPFIERWSGLFDEEAVVRGTISLARIPNGDDSISFATGLPQELPQGPRFTPPDLPRMCPAAAREARGGRGTCAATASASELVQCADALMAISVPLETAELVVDDGAGGYATLPEACESELNADLLPTGLGGGIECIRLSNLECAMGYYGAAAQAGLAAGYGGLARVASSRAGVALLLANDELAQAYDVPFERDQGVGTVVLSHMSEAGEWTSEALGELFQPFLLQALRRLHPASAAQHEFQGLRRLAQLLARDWLTANERTQLVLRMQPWSWEDIRSEVNARGLPLLLSAVALATIESSQMAPPSPEVTLLANAMSQLGQRTLEATVSEAILGVSEDYVPFVFDGAMQSADQSTNFQLLLNMHRTEVEQAAAHEGQARDSRAQYEHSVEALNQELVAIEDQTNSRLVALCGARADNLTLPDLEDCGQGTGELATAYSVQREAAQGIDIAMARMEGLAARVEVQRQRLQQVYKIRSETITFVDETNAEIRHKQFAIRQLEAAKDLVSLAAHAGLGSPGAAVAGGAAMALTIAQTHIEDAQAELRDAKELRLLQSDANVEYINGMSAIKEMLVGMVELSLEMGLATLQAVTAAVRAESLLEQRDVALAELELLQEHQLDDGRLNDPAFRVLQNRAMLRARESLEQARRGLFLVARAYEVETNTDFPPIETRLLPAMRADELVDFQQCLQSSFVAFREAYQTPAVHEDEISLREDILRISGPITDDVTGEEISEAEQFQRLLLDPSNIDADGSVSLRFVTNVTTGNGVFSTHLCNDQIRGLRVRLIGDNLGDDRAEVVLQLRGTSFLRSCETGRNGSGDMINEYNLLDSPRVVLSAGVNRYLSNDLNMQLFGRPVGNSEWVLTINPGDSSPANADLEVGNIEDIVILLEHSAFSLSESSFRYEPAC
jgi:hypothetical protein